MKDYHTKFDFTLLVLGPVHIGSGEKYTKKEYVYENNKYYFPDMGRLYLRIKDDPRLNSAFTAFMTEINDGRRTTTLGEFLSANSISDRDFGGYSISESGYEFEKSSGRSWNGRNRKPGAGRNLNEISAFVKDSYGRPYIPGSSLKGAIRTILINEEFKTDDVPWKDGDNIFNEIRISDSKPISVDNLTLVQKWDYNARKNAANALPLWRESLKPMTRVRFTITTTSGRAKELVGKLDEYSRRFYERYHEKFLCDYPDGVIQKNILNPLYLGAGSGLWTKVDYHHVNLERIQSRAPKKMRLKGNGVLKLTRYMSKSVRVNGSVMKLDRNSFYEMGKCGFRIKEVSD
ncbi:type III-A CRISPR-associated RAMP protein Csm5 [Ligilactobacillus ruminis]|uniref:type III-A CRISPR-associated RAMP protein Csm5 n=1 Tax=Ligilactobacillus ruminis TaxID=1623 RepID=UPI001F264F36|nr:type III-A CRISPR-associated RAMP protein Csm5 [Ligilactobacillus ruminis]MCF2543787.1 type III-A CRISPR-associated RAMP protein Csm5 [Ligilactobacillus ruminis]MCR5749521.1 type III-A CRISPR-associated RAMP protein Csm5 [Lactobacillus sp.]